MRPPPFQFAYTMATATCECGKAELYDLGGGSGAMAAPPGTPAKPKEEEEEAVWA